MNNIKVYEIKLPLEECVYDSIMSDGEIIDENLFIQMATMRETVYTLKEWQNEINNEIVNIDRIILIK